MARTRTTHTAPTPPPHSECGGRSLYEQAVAGARSSLGVPAFEEATAYALGDEGDATDLPPEPAA